MSLHSKRLQRQSAKAHQIEGTINACRLHIQKKYDRELAEHAKLEREIPEDIARGKELKKAGATEAELEGLARQINDKKMQLFQLKSSKSIFGSTLSVLAELEAIIRTVSRHEWYRYIIRFVPYKRLPEMIKAERETDIPTILSLVKSANEKLKSKVLSALHNDAEREAFQERLQAEMDVINSMYGEKKSATSMFDDEEEATNPAPVNANVTNQETNAASMF